MSPNPPSDFDLAAEPLAGHGVPLAILFTASCWWYVLVALAVAMIAVAVVAPAWRARVTFAVLTTLVTWQLSDLLKAVFHRARPGYWTAIHETSGAYSSGHAMFAVVIYGLWAWFVWNSPLPRGFRVVLAPFLVLWALGVLWSRLALGAHWPTDLCGGILLGIAALSGASLIASAAGASRARRAAV